MNPNESDHDILLDMRGDIKVLKEAMQEMKDTTKAQITDHELRIRLIERWVWSAIGVLTVAVIIIGWILIIKYNNR